MIASSHCDDDRHWEKAHFEAILDSGRSATSDDGTRSTVASNRPAHSQLSWSTRRTTNQPLTIRPSASNMAPFPLTYQSTLLAHSLTDKSEL